MPLFMIKIKESHLESSSRSIENTGIVVDDRKKEPEGVPLRSSSISLQVSRRGRKRTPSWRKAAWHQRRGSNYERWVFC